MPTQAPRVSHASARTAVLDHFLLAGTCSAGSWGSLRWEPETGDGVLALASVDAIRIWESSSSRAVCEVETAELRSWFSCWLGDESKVPSDLDAETHCAKGGSELVGRHSPVDEAQWLQWLEMRANFRKVCER